MRLNLFALVPALMLSACEITVYDDTGRSSGHPDNTPPVNHAPNIQYADGGCYWDGNYRDDIWYFDADVTDPDGVYDVVAVYADVYDMYTGWLEDSFELFATNDPIYWTSDWMGSSTWLDCDYGGYVVDIVAYDTLDAMDVESFMPWTRDLY